MSRSKKPIPTTPSDIMTNFIKKGLLSVVASRLVMCASMVQFSISFLS